MAQGTFICRLNHGEFVIQSTRGDADPSTPPSIADFPHTTSQIDRSGLVLFLPDADGSIHVLKNRRGHTGVFGASSDTIDSINQGATPAFPTLQRGEGGTLCPEDGAVTLRDYFAARVMAALLTNPVAVAEAGRDAAEEDAGAPVSVFEILSRQAYQCADAMIAWRNSGME